MKQRTLAALFLGGLLALSGCSSDNNNPMESMMEMETTMSTLKGLTSAIADPDGDGKISEDPLNEFSKRPGEPFIVSPRGRTYLGRDELNTNHPSIPDAEEFSLQRGADHADLLDFDAEVHQRTKNKKTDVVTLYSNEEPAGNEPFNDYYSQAQLANRKVRPGGITSITDTTDTLGDKVTYNTLEFDETNIDGVAKYMTSSKIPTESGRHTEVTGEALTFDGTFHGVPGKYTCSENCEFRTDMNGILGIRAVDGGREPELSFRPNATIIDTQDSHVVKGVTFDTDYLIFGYWVQTGTGRKDAPTYAVDAFYGGSELVSTIGRAQGSATYEGEATGMYAKKTLAVEGGSEVGTPSEVGQFTANADLTANFDAGGTVGELEKYKLTGTIDNFQNTAGEKINSAWSLSLDGRVERQDLSEGTTTGTGSNVKGQWEGRFYGAPNAAVPAEAYPQSVAGKFTGHFQDGHVIGAFGATRQ